MIAKTNFVAKAAAVVAGLGLVFASVAPIASAQTTTTTTTSTQTSAQLQAQIAALLAQIQALQAQLGSSSTGSVMFTVDLTVGSSGASVTALQTWLIGKGYSIPAGATGYFGSQTKAAVAAFQAANGITPAAGYFGPITRAKVNSMAGGSTTTTTTTGGTTTTTGGTLSGGEGSIDNFKIVGATNTSLNAADSDTVYGFEFKADGSDLAVNRVDYDIYKSAGTGSTRPSNIFQTAELWYGSTKIASMDISNVNSLSQDGTASNGNQIYRIRFDGLNTIVKQGSTADFYLKLYTQSGISDSNAGTGTVYTVVLTPQGLRATDAMGIQQYSSSATQTSATVSVSNTTTGSLTLSTGSNNPATQTVMGNTNSQTSGIVLNTFSLQAKDADINVYTIPVQIATTSSNATNQIRSLKLYQGSTLIDTESVPTTGANAGTVSTTTFQNLNIHIAEGQTQNFSIQADINSIDGSNFSEGASVAATVPSYGWDAENGSGDQVTINGSSTGNTITFRSIGFSADSSPSVASATANNNGQSASQTGTFTFTFNVTAFGQDVYLATTSSKAFAGGIYNSNGVLVSTTTTSAITSTADRTSDGTNNYVVHNGQTKQVTVTFALDNTNNTTGFYYARLNTLYFATSTSALNSTTTEASITLPTTYQTNQVNLHS